MRMGVLRFSGFCLLLLLFILPSALGGGFTFDGLGVKARGMGGAFRALADDWSAAYYNPAGYVRIQDNVIAGNLAIFHNRYSAEPNVLWDGEYETGYLNGQELYNHHDLLNVPQGAILARLPVWGESVFGLSIMQLFDQNHSWELYRHLAGYNWSDFPTHQFYNNLDVVAFQVTGARQFMDERLSVGIGLAVLRGDLIFNGVVLRQNPMPPPINARPYDKIPEWLNNDGTGWGFGYRAGVIYQLNDKIDLGFVYTGKSSINVSGEANLKFYMGDNPTLVESEDYFPTTEEYHFLAGIVNDIRAEFETTLETPASLAAGIAMRASEKLVVDMDIEYTFWSAFKGFDFTFSEYRGLPNAQFTHAHDLIKTDISFPADWDNTFRIMAGANYRIRDNIELRGGMGLDQSPVSEETFTPYFMDLGTKYSLSAGIGFEFDFWHLDLGTTYTHQPDLDVVELMETNYGGEYLMDNLPAGYRADNYMTVLGISYRF